MSQCSYKGCDEIAIWPETVYNAETGESKDVILCDEHRELVLEYDSKNREEMDLPGEVA